MNANKRTHKLLSHHRAHLLRLGLPEPPEQLDIHGDEYQHDLSVLRRSYPGASDDELHMRALGHAWTRQSAAESKPVVHSAAPEVHVVKLDHKRELRWILAVLAVIALLLLFQPKAHAQFSHINNIDVRNSDNTSAAFIASPFTLKAGANCTWVVSGVTITFNCTGGSGAAWDAITNPTAGGLSLTQFANGNDFFTVTRKTDTAPTGNFLRFKNAAAADLFTVDITGKATATGYDSPAGATAQRVGVHPATNGGTCTAGTCPTVGFQAPGSVPASDLWFGLPAANSAGGFMFWAAPVAGVSISTMQATINASNITPGDLQGTDAKLLTSGTNSGTAGGILCDDANSGATTEGCKAIPVHLTIQLADFFVATDGAAGLTGSNGTFSSGDHNYTLAINNGGGCTFLAAVHGGMKCITAAGTNPSDVAVYLNNWREPIGTLTFDHELVAQLDSATTAQLFYGFAAVNNYVEADSDFIAIGCKTASDATWMLLTRSGSGAVNRAAITGSTCDASAHYFRLWSTVAGTINATVDTHTVTGITTGVPTANLHWANEVQTDSVTARYFTLFRYSLKVDVAIP